MKRLGLAARFVETIKKPGTYADGGGLYLRVSGQAGKSWVYRYRDGNRRPEMGLGSFPLLSLGQARDKRDELRRLLLNGVDPLRERKAKAAAAAIEAARAKTFEDCAREFLRKQQHEWKSPAAAAARWDRNFVMHVYPTLGAVPVQLVNQDHLLRVLEPLWQGKTATATYLRGQIEAVLEYAEGRAWREGTNPAQWKGGLKRVLPNPSKFRPEKHYGSLPHAEIFELLAKIEGLPKRGGMAARALRFAILTAVRASEATGARWSEMRSGTWAIPGARKKENRDFQVPLSTAALALLAEMESCRRDDFVFPGRNAGESIHPTGMIILMRKLGYPAFDVTTHGFRSAFASWSAETNVSYEVSEAAIAHRAGPLRRRYQRSQLVESREQVMERWGVYCTEGPAPKVVPLRRVVS